MCSPHREHLDRKTPINCGSQPNPILSSQHVKVNTSAKALDHLCVGQFQAQVSFTGHQSSEGPHAVPREFWRFHNVTCRPNTI